MSVILNDVDGPENKYYTVKCDICGWATNWDDYRDSFNVYRSVGGSNKHICMHCVDRLVEREIEEAENIMEC
jgi:hypothetical protein